MRPTWDETFLMMAVTIARRGTCPRARVGAVVVGPDHRILSVGYNGAPARQPHCTDVGCIILPSGGCGRAVHAEVNALMQAGPAARNATLYVTMSPCYACSSVIVNAGVLRVVYWRRYRVVPDVPDPLDFLEECGVEAVQLTLHTEE